MKSIGIDIGATSIKLAEVSLQRNELHLLSVQEIPLGQVQANDTTIEVLETLRAQSEKFDPQSYRVVSCLTQDKVSVRLKPFPFTDRLKILKILPFELEEELPFSTESAIFDGKIIRTLGPQSEVLACVAPKLRISEAVQKFIDAHMPLHLLTSEGIALGTCFENWNAPPLALPPQPLELEESQTKKQIQVVLHIGHSHCVLCFLENNILAGTRSILWGSHWVAQAIAKKYEVPYVEAMKEFRSKAFILTNKGNTTYEQVVFSETIQKACEELAQDVQISLFEIQSQLNCQIEGVYISGGGSQITNLNAFLTQKLEIPVNRLKFFDRFKRVHFDVTPRHEATFAIAVGLAIDGLRKPRNPSINFLKGEFQKESGSFKKFIQDWKFPIQMSLLAFGAFVAFSIMRESITANLSEITHSALKAKAKEVAHIDKPTVEKIKKHIQEQRKKIQDAKALEKVMKMNSAMDILKKINDSIPPRSKLNVHLSRLNIKDDSVQMEGVLPSASDLNSLKSVLGPLVKSGKIKSESSGQSGPGVPFALSFKVDRGVELVKDSRSNKLKGDLNSPLDIPTMNKDGSTPKEVR